MRHLLVFLIRIYQRQFSRWTPAVCRFEPTCSQYAVLSIEKYGAVKGLWLGICRLARCHPFSRGGYDPVR